MSKKLLCRFSLKWGSFHLFTHGSLFSEICQFSINSERFWALSMSRDIHLSISVIKTSWRAINAGNLIILFFLPNWVILRHFTAQKYKLDHWLLDEKLGYLEVACCKNGNWHSLVLVNTAMEAIFFWQKQCMYSRSCCTTQESYLKNYYVYSIWLKLYVYSPKLKFGVYIILKLFVCFN